MLAPEAYSKDAVKTRFHRKFYYLSRAVYKADLIAALESLSLFEKITVHIMEVILLLAVAVLKVISRFPFLWVAVSTQHQL